MKRQKINKKLTLLAIVGILTFSCIPFVAAGNGNGRVTKRPIEDWLAPVTDIPLGKTVGCEHRSYEAFANIVNISFNRTDNDLS